MENHIYKYQITLKQQLIILAHLVFITIGFIIYGLYQFFINDYNISAFFIVLTFLFLIDTLPTIIVHTQYWIKNHGAIFTINTETKELKYEKSTRQFFYSFNDIISLQYYRNLGKGSGWNSFGQYRYYKIILNDKKEIIITCLMINDIENTLEMLLHIKAERHAKMLCLIE